LDDADALARRAAQGDRGALEQLLTAHADHVHAVCRRVLADPEDALDATQEAMIAIARGIATFDGRSRFTTWMYRVATNAALDEARRRQRRPTPVEDVGATAPPAFGSVGGAAVDERVSTRLDVDAALRALPEEFRAAVVLRDLADLDYAEIAEVLGIPPGTVRSRISRGRALLHTALGGSTGNQPGADVRRSDDG
jgi:RNA polymerase sigma-70 factor (ECF subfamily)